MTTPGAGGQTLGPVGMGERQANPMEGNRTMAFDIPTVGELIRRLQEFPPESPVGTFDALAPACRIYEVTAHESGVVVITGSDSPMYDDMECSADDSHPSPPVTP